MRAPPFADEAKRKELAERLSAIELSIPDEALKRRPNFGLSLLKDPHSRAKFLEAFDWAMSEIKNAEQTAAAGALTV
jgi:hypothetical protein